MTKKAQYTDSITITFANGETETYRRLSQYAANLLFAGNGKDGIKIVHSAVISGTLYLRDSENDWQNVKA